MHYFSLVLFVCCSLVVEHQNPVEDSISQTRLEMAHELVIKALEADGGSAISVAVWHRGELWTDAVGHADLEAQVAATPMTRFRVGSVSKVITVALLGDSVMRNTVDLDAPIQKYVPSFPEKSGAVTLRRLAWHTAGVRHYDFSNFEEANNLRMYSRLSDALDVWQGDPLVAKPGSQHEYSSFGYNLIGVALANAEEKTFGDLSLETLARLGMTRTRIDHSLEIIPDRARFYHVMDGQLINTYWRDSSDYYPSGGFLSTPTDLVQLGKATFHGEHFSPAVAKLFTTPGKLNDGTELPRALAWRVHREADGKSWYSHGGVTNGGYGEILCFPEEQLILTGATNYAVTDDEEGTAFYWLLNRDLLALFRE